MPCRDGEGQANLDRHLAAIGEARRAGVDLLLFPELSLTGYRGGAEAAARGTVPGADVLDALLAVAGTMLVSVGLPERDAAGLAYNTQLLLGAGRVLHRHRKLNLPTYGTLEEGRHFAPGRRIEPVRLGAWTVATLICADTWNPALPWLAALAGADLLLVPVASAEGAVGGGHDQDAGWTVNLRHTAMTYGLPVVMANHPGDGPGAFWGGSRILDPAGHDLAQAGRSPALITARLDRAAVRQARTHLPTIRDADPGLVAEELARIREEACRDGSGEGRCLSPPLPVSPG